MLVLSRWRRCSRERNVLLRMKREDRVAVLKLECHVKR